jgi:hypothetical protein
MIKINKNNHSKEHIEKIRISALGRKHTEETKKKISEKMKNRKLSEKTKQKISKKNKGKIRTTEQRKNISISHFGISSGKKGKALEEKTKKKIRNTLKGRKDTKLTRKRKRLSRIKYIEKIKLEGNQLYPVYNKKACVFFDRLNNITKTNGKHALNEGEYYIKELGYWLDYINHELKIIIEWNENHHYDINGKLKEKDVLRKKEIKNIFKSYKYIILKQSELSCQLA